MQAGAGGEIQLTDAIAEEIRTGAPRSRAFASRVSASIAGRRRGFLQATVAFGLARPDLRDEFSAYLDDLFALRKAAE